ncbi:CopD family protein [Roseateles oligotrophus]|uniref:CopD family protein n=1 Tax=Roseateles oligotrophus TaxID=1769250 RepID=A0ABT2YDG9_9BURK|nr:CopD family protein [Roseateles oligotrophus]MCV2368103.1 CopD family protein [Roseateles oligotrophus]
MTLIHAVLLGLHLLAVALWVGGMATVLLAVRPAALQVLEAPPLRLQMLTATLARFFNLVQIAITVLLATGLLMLTLLGGRAHWTAHAMLGLGLLMMGLFAHIRWALFPRLQRAVAEQAWPAAGAAMNAIRPWVGFNLGLGCAVVLIAVLGRAL